MQYNQHYLFTYYRNILHSRFSEDITPHQQKPLDFAIVYQWQSLFSD